MKVERIIANVKRWSLTCVECHMFDSTKAVDHTAGNIIYIFAGNYSCIQSAQTTDISKCLGLRKFTLSQQ